jgi:simple sugar transport system ATP-binding protein
VSAPAAPAPLLELRGIEKRFGAVAACRGVDLALAPGEVLGLLGENGAGKTTLMNVLFGLYRADAGTIRVDGRAVAIRGPADALAHGIGMVHQHFHLVGRLSVLDNLLIGRPGRGGRLDRAGARARLEALGARFGLRLDPEREVASLTVGEQQRLEIVKALDRGARILILDEPTSVLTPQESEGLFAAIRALAAQGFGVIFISHKLAEVRAITDRVVVLRQGQVAATLANDGTVTARQLALLMCGQDLAPPQKTAQPPGPALLELAGIATLPAAGHGVALRGIDLALHGGEILGVAGVSGNGQRELAEVIAGVLRPAAGMVRVRGQAVRRPGPRAMQRAGIAAIPEDRIGAGLLSAAPLADSLVLERFRSAPFSRAGILRPAAIRAFAAEQIARFGIKAPGPAARTGTLSGGNLQKALLARALAFDPLVLVAAQPTRGLDVAAQAFVHGRFLDLRARGRAVLLISEDLEELFALSDRIAVMHGGRLVALLPAAAAEIGRIGLLMAGAAADAA